MRRVHVLPLLGVAALHCGDPQTAATDGAASSTSTSTAGATLDPGTGAPTSSAAPTTGASASATATSAPTSGVSDSDSATTSASDTDAPDTCADSPHYRVGAGIADVTGPSAELVMMGYSMPEQKAEGISTRLWSRAFVVESPCSGGRLVFVSADLGQVFQGVHTEVLKRLAQKFGPDRYTRDNVALSATHTHSGLGGFSHYTMFNLAVGGFDPDNFEAVVAGIVESIVRADANLGDGVIKIAEGPLQDANWNRSPQAYAGNPADERAAHEAEHQRNTDTRMTVLRLERTAPGETSGEPIAAFTWFSSHATSVSNQNRLVSSDHKGHASYVFERSMGADYSAPAPFVAAFAQGDAGDVSPNEVFLGEPNTVARPCDNSPDPECNDLANARIHGELQYARARELFDGASELLRGPVDGRLSYVDMEKVDVDAQYTNGAGPQKTCHAAIGLSIAAGAEDGVAVAFIEEGVVYGDNWPKITILPEDQACHLEKTILLPVGRMVPQPWSPLVLPAQVMRIGNLGLVPVPFEITTMSGSRVRSTVQAHLPGVDHVVVAGLSNAYSSYVTTREEYKAQHYEGAFTQFGPWTLAAWQQEFARVADALTEGKPAADTGVPLDLSKDQVVQVLPVVADSPCALPDAILCPFEKFGDVVLAPPKSAKAGEHVVVRFRGAHPRNNLRTGTGYLEVQRDDGMNWQTVAHDWDPETTFRWQRTGGGLSPTSEVTIDWHLPADVVPGTYRIVYHGDAKSLGGVIKPISGTSPTFVVMQ